MHVRVPSSCSSSQAPFLRDSSRNDIIPPPQVLLWGSFLPSLTQRPLSCQALLFTHLCLYQPTPLQIFSSQAQHVLSSGNCLFIKRCHLCLEVFSVASCLQNTVTDSPHRMLLRPSNVWLSFTFQHLLWLSEMKMPFYGLFCGATLGLLVCLVCTQLGLQFPVHFTMTSCPSPHGRMVS